MEKAKPYSSQRYIERLPYEHLKVTALEFEQIKQKYEDAPYLYDELDQFEHNTKALLPMRKSLAKLTHTVANRVDRFHAPEENTEIAHEMALLESPFRELRRELRDAREIIDDKDKDIEHDLLDKNLLRGGHKVARLAQAAMHGQKSITVRQVSAEQSPPRVQEVQYPIEKLIEKYAEPEDKLEITKIIETAEAIANGEPKQQKKEKDQLKAQKDAERRAAEKLEEKESKIRSLKSYYRRAPRSETTRSIMDSPVGEKTSLIKAPLSSNEAEYLIIATLKGIANGKLLDEGLVDKITADPKRTWSMTSLYNALRFISEKFHGKVVSLEVEKLSPEDYSIDSIMKRSPLVETTSPDSVQLIRFTTGLKSSGLPVLHGYTDFAVQVGENQDGPGQYVTEVRHRQGAYTDKLIYDMRRLSNQSAAAVASQVVSGGLPGTSRRS